MQITNSLVFPSISINDGNIASVIGIIVIGSVFLTDICRGEYTFIMLKHQTHLPPHWHRAVH